MDHPGTHCSGIQHPVIGLLFFCGEVSHPPPPVQAAPGIALTVGKRLGWPHFLLLLWSPLLLQIPPPVPLKSRPPVPLDKGSLASQVHCLYSEHKALLLAPGGALVDPTTPKTRRLMAWLSISFLELPLLAFLLPIKLPQVALLPSEIPQVILLLPWTTLLRGLLLLPRTASLVVLLLPRI